MIDLTTLVIYAHSLTASGKLSPTLRPRSEAAVSGYSTGYHGWQHPEKPLRFRGPSPNAPLIPRSRWTTLIQGLAGKTIPEVFPLPAKDQNGLNYCWAYGTTRAVEYARAIQQLPQLDLSPESVGGPPSNWRNIGGYASEAMQQLQSAGACETRFMDSPHSLRPQSWDPAWIADAVKQEATNWQELDYTSEDGPFDSVITALLNGHPVAAGLSWWGHLVCFVAPVLLPAGSASPNTPDGQTVGVVFQNSWGPDWPRPGDNGFAILTEDAATPDGAAVPIVVT